MLIKMGLIVVGVCGIVYGQCELPTLIGPPGAYIYEFGFGMDATESMMCAISDSCFIENCGVFVHEPERDAVSGDEGAWA
jgi:hypothetical protein